ncbi:MAG: tRNA 2-thiouridine(34) synthase MnmA [Patescibacteria group bacterium]|nr:tRNA 2-thiouridine(34) synthase MnmA [Patescibacteria group bacterium]
MVKKTKILVGLSGGVDSAVSLYLLKKQGYRVEAAYMKCFSENINLKGQCPWKEDRLMAYRIAAQLQVPIRTLNFENQYHKKIVNYIFSAYKKGLTPNPDILCNNEIKFKLFVDYAIKAGFTKIATGHYARVKEFKKGFSLLRGLDPDKDQSYFLSGLNQKQLSLAIFPIGELRKTQVRTLAKKSKLANADKPDSQGICFIGKVDLKTFLSQKIKPKKGKIIDTKGKELGGHQGVWYYTIGQRKGLDLPGGPWYIAEKDIKNNRLIVAKADSPELYKKEIIIGNLHWLNQEYKLPLKTKAQIRYRQPAQNIILYKNKAIFKTPQKGVASGQILAVYKGVELIASGNIV